MYYLTDFSVRNLGVAYLESSSSGSFIRSQAVGWGFSQSQGLTEEGESPVYMVIGRPQLVTCKLLD